MRKLCSLTLALLLLVSTFAGCQSSQAAWGKEDDWSIEPVPESLKQEIIDLLYWGANASALFDSEYYGTCGDRVILANKEVTQAITQFTVAGEDFYWPKGFQIRVYANGNICYLGEAYEKGLISKENVAKIAEYHRQELAERGYSEP